MKRLGSAENEDKERKGWVEEVNETRREMLLLAVTGKFTERAKGRTKMPST